MPEDKLCSAQEILSGKCGFFGILRVLRLIIEEFIELRALIRGEPSPTAPIAPPGEDPDA